MSVTLVLGANSVTVRNPEFENTEPVEIVQARGRTADGKLLVTDKGLSLERIRIEWTELSTAKKDELLDFFGSSKANGSANSFTYTDHKAVAHVVRLVTDTLEPVEYFEGWWSLALELEEEVS